MITEGGMMEARRAGTMLAIITAAAGKRGAINQTWNGGEVMAVMSATSNRISAKARNVPITVPTEASRVAFLRTIKTMRQNVSLSASELFALRSELNRPDQP
jgi:hypothetical protein